jgi:uncharacterized damage-inducible protein DinB
MKTQLSDYVRYNLWANDGLIELFRQQDPSVIDRPIVSSFSSIRETLMHLWSVELIWMEQLKGNSPKTFAAQTFTGSNEELFDNLHASSSAFVAFVEAQPESYFEIPLTFGLITASGTFTHTPTEMIWHCMNHQTFHRGQLITMGRQAGISAFPRTDFIFYKRDTLL